MGDIRVHLSGGPEGGHEISIATDASGLPIPRIALPARRSASTRAPAEQEPPLLIYERSRSRPDGSWEFRYVGAQAAT
ncbi:hypothetical protein [Parasphingorhabdus pacifica]